MTHPDILLTERLGSRDYEIRTLGRCACCGTVVTTEDGEACSGSGELFCSVDCFLNYFGFCREGV